eukprot:TRINITY_DN1991_c0_g1_i1.p1 TRINITY_DN1991_c0_g1~~TRINITY_DN1991_c0_g1_i1.p1  ORF type:complete len:520 (+),score=65.12 TRINITY_DN1991_c0_g1_i1:1063-2622(+)
MARHLLNKSNSNIYRLAKRASFIEDDEDNNDPNFPVIKLDEESGGVHPPHKNHHPLRHPNRHKLKPSEVIELNVILDEDKDRKKDDDGGVVVKTYGTYDYDVDLKDAIPFLSGVARVYHASGAPTSHSVILLTEVAKSLGIQTEWHALPSAIFVTYTDRNGMPVSAVMHCSQNFGPFSKMYDAQMLMEKVINKKISFQDACKRLKEIEEQPRLYKDSLRLFAFGMSSSMASILAFNGGWFEMVSAFWFGFFSGLLDILSAKHPNLSLISGFIKSVVVTFFSLVFIVYIPTEICFISIVLSALLLSMPGMALTMSVHELASRSFVSGTTRFFMGIFIAVQLAFGIGFGMKLVNLWVPSDVLNGALSSNHCVDYFSDWFDLLWLPLLLLSYALLLDVDLQFWPGCILTGSVAYGIKFGLQVVDVERDLSSLIASFAVGIIGNLISRIPNQLGLIYIFSGLLLLVPGSLGVKGAAAALQSELGHATQFAQDMIITLFAISIGGFVSSILLMPRTWVLFNKSM